jgi:hypothetical protein
MLPRSMYAYYTSKYLCKCRIGIQGICWSDTTPIRIKGTILRDLKHSAIEREVVCLETVHQQIVMHVKAILTGDVYRDKWSIIRYETVYFYLNLYFTVY